MGEHWVLLLAPVILLSICARISGVQSSRLPSIDNSHCIAVVIPQVAARFIFSLGEARSPAVRTGKQLGDSRRRNAENSKDAAAYRRRAFRSFGGYCWMRPRASNSDINRSKPLVPEGSPAPERAPEWSIRVQEPRRRRRISALKRPNTSLASPEPDVANAARIRIFSYSALIDRSLCLAMTPRNTSPRFPDHRRNQ